MTGGKERQNNPPSSNQGEIKDISKSKLKQKVKIHKSKERERQYKIKGQKQRWNTQVKEKKEDKIHKSKDKYAEKIKHIIMFKHKNNQTSKSTDTGKTAKKREKQ